MPPVLSRHFVFPVLLFLASGAHAQKHLSAEQFLRAQGAAHSARSRTEGNLASMLTSLPAQQARELDNALGVVALFEAYDYSVTALVSVYTRLQGSADREAAKQYLLAARDTTAEFADKSVQAINGVLPHLTSPAVIGEAERLRNQVQDEIDLLRGL